MLSVSVYIVRLRYIYIYIIIIIIGDADASVDAERHNLYMSTTDTYCTKVGRGRLGEYIFFPF